MPHQRPATAEYADYYATYIDQVPDGAILDILRSQRAQSREMLGAIDEALGDHRYAPGKWTIKEVLGHVLDAERVFGFRALHFARSAPDEIPGMDQDTFAEAAPYERRTIASIAEELFLLRSANLAQFEPWDSEILNRTGVASGVRFSCRSLLYIIAGHERHHMRVLRERYL